jgi:hypothetical protein
LRNFLDLLEIREAAELIFGWILPPPSVGLPASCRERGQQPRLEALRRISVRRLEKFILCLLGRPERKGSLILTEVRPVGKPIGERLD